MPHDEEDRTDSIRYALLDALDQQIARCESGNVPIRSLPDETVAEAFLRSLAARGWEVEPVRPPPPAAWCTCGAGFAIGNEPARPHSGDCELIRGARPR